MKLSGMLCLLVGHKRDSGRVWHDGHDFRSRCKRCDVPMVRELDGWRVADDEAG